MGNYLMNNTQSSTSTINNTQKIKFDIESLSKDYEQLAGD